MVNSMKKVKLFDEDHELDLEDEINDFLADFEGELIDIKYQVAIAKNDEEMEYSFSALLLYEEYDE